MYKISSEETTINDPMRGSNCNVKMMMFSHNDTQLATTDDK